MTRRQRTAQLSGLVAIQGFLAVFVMVAVLLVRELGFSVIHEITEARQYVNASGEVVAIGHHSPAILMAAALVFQVPQLVIFTRLYRSHCLRAWLWVFALSVLEMIGYIFVLAISLFFVVTTRHPG